MIARAIQSKEEIKMEPFVAYLLVGIVIVLLGFLSIRKGSQKKHRCTATASAMNDMDINKYPIAMRTIFRFIYLQTSDLTLNILPICDK